MTNPTILVLSKLKDCKRSGPGWSARCPAHEDHQPSLTVTEGTDGRVLLHCHAGCTTERVADALDLEIKDLFPNAHNGSAVDDASFPLGMPDEVYDYTDEEGNLLFQVLRYPRKQFRQRSRDDFGLWKYTTAGIRKPLYNLPAVRRAITAHETVYVVEGEKDADSLMALGLVATTNPNGAGHWLPEHSTSLLGADVVIIPDNDVTGNDHALRVADGLLGIADKVRLVRLDRIVPEKEDVTFWLTEGGTRDELLALVNASPEHVPTESPVDSQTGCYAHSFNRGGFVRAADMEHVPPIKWVVDGFIPAGETVGLIGAPGAGKSFVMTDLALSISAGIPWHGRNVQQGTVAIIAAEGASGLPQRFRAWKQAKEMPGADFNVHILPQAVPLLDLAARERLLVQLGELPQPIRVVVVDTMAQCLSPEGDENSAMDMGAVMQLAREIADATCAAVVFVHHPGKGGAGERGSSAFRGAAAVMINLERDGNDVELHTTKVRDGVPGAHLSLAIIPFGDSAVLIESSSRSASRRSPSMSPNELKIVTALSDGGAQTYGQLKLASGVGGSSLDRALKSLSDRGLIVKDTTTRPAKYFVVLEAEVPGATEVVAANCYPAPTPVAPPNTTPYRGGGEGAPSGVAIKGQPFSPSHFEDDVEEESAALAEVD